MTTVEEGTAIVDKIRVTTNAHLMTDVERDAVQAGINGQSGAVIDAKLDTEYGVDGSCE